MALRNLLSRLPVDRFLLTLVATIALAAVLPAQGRFADVFDWVTYGAVALLFFVYGARLSPAAVRDGLLHWRLQGLIFLATFALFPMLGLLAHPLAERALPPELAFGVLFVCLLPSTVQSSIAFTSIAGGNVPAAFASASASNLLGVLATPLLVLLIGAGGAGVFGFKAILTIATQILLPFLVGQALRPLIGGWIARHRGFTALIDRSSILLVVYGAFSEGVVAGVWSQLRASDLLVVVLFDAALLGLVLAATTLAARRLGFKRADEIAIVFCGSKKSMATGIPMATILFPGGATALTVLPLMLFHQIQLFACAAVAQRYARRMPAAEPDKPPAEAAEERRGLERTG